MRNEEFERRADALEEGIARRQLVWRGRLKWLLAGLALALIAVPLLMHPLGTVLSLEGSLTLAAVGTGLVFWLMPLSAAAVGAARKTADVDSALPAEAGTVTFLSEDGLVVGPSGKQYRLDGRVRIESVSYDEEFHQLKVQVYDEGGSAGSQDRTPPRAFNVFLPLPKDWTEARALWLVKRWTRWMSAGPNAARADFPPPASAVG